MKVPFFRPRTREHASSSASTASSKTQRHESPTTSPAALAPADAEPKSQLAELQAFLGRISGFRGDARRLFPENVALDQMLGELRDECQRRVDYMARVSVQPAWMSPQQHPSVATPANNNNSNNTPRRSRLFSALSGTGTAKGRPDPATSAVSSSGDDSSGSDSDRLERHHHTTPVRIRHSIDPPAAAAATIQHDPRSTADRRRKTAPQSVLLGSMSGDAPSPLPAHPRASMALSPAGPPRLPRLRTSSIDALARSPPLAAQLAQSGGSTPDISRLASNPRNSIIGSSSRPQHVSATAATATAGTTKNTEYLVKLRVAGSRIEAAVSQALQTSLISMQLATALNMPITRMPSNTRVWSSSGKSWLVVGEVAGMPFACGNMTFSHNFKVVHGAAAANDMARDIVLGNDFCVGNKGRIKDNRLHLEKLAMPISVPVRQITAS
ncbi:hypothetical protein H4R19_003825 [Coemansia spiralis]|nr:hypothetical protein H4R19_003825 [Coemansia spiralis]